MEWLNYHHLLYFWLVAREGSLHAACAQLRLSQSTVSGQVRKLEEALGEKLFQRKGRQLVLTEVGRLVFRYADEIFGLGRELQDALRGQPVGRPLRLSVGVADVVPKLVAQRILEPALRLRKPVRMVCHEDKPERLLAELAVHELDVVISDAPVGPGVRVRAFHHLLGRVRRGVVRQRQARGGAQAGASRARSTARRSCCRRSRPRCAGRSRAGSRAARSARASSPSSRTARCSRCSAKPGTASSRCRT